MAEAPLVSSHQHLIAEAPVISPTLNSRSTAQDAVVSLASRVSRFQYPIKESEKGMVMREWPYSASATDTVLS